jgi:hypothetical protein
MKSLLEPRTAQEMIRRIEQLTPATEARWGKMNAAQMMAHCSYALELYLTGAKLKRPLIGILFGPMIKKRMLTPKPWAKNLPTAKELKPAVDSDFEKEKTNLIENISLFVVRGPKLTPIPHPFFGKMTTADWGLHQYKHLDHHLTQFGV